MRFDCYGVEGKLSPDSGRVSNQPCSFGGHEKAFIWPHGSLKDHFDEPGQNMIRTIIIVPGA